LRGLKYTPLFEYFRSEEAKHPAMYTVLVDSYVTNDSGVGIVHQAPAFGEDDYRVCLEAGVISKGMGIPCPVDDDGLFTSPVEDFKGLHVKGVETKDPVTGKGNQDSTDDKICAVLKAQGRLVQKAVCAHTYPYCWRSDTPLIYKAVPSWCEANLQILCLNVIVFVQVREGSADQGAAAG
jgi:isoleucyl-tRNA synthetase